MPRKPAPKRYRWRTGTPVRTVNDATTMFLAHCQAQRLSDNTIHAYVNDLRTIERIIRELLEIPRDQPIPIEDIDRNLLTDAFAEYAADHAPSSHRRCWAAWNGMLQHLVSHEIIDRNPMAQVPSANGNHGTSVPNALPPEAVERLLSTLADPQPEYRTDKYRQWWQRDYAMILLMLATGVRTDELCELNIGSVSPTFDESGARTITVVGKGGKERKIPIEKPVGEAIDEYLVSRASRLPETVNDTSRNSFSRWAPDQPLFIKTDGTRINDTTLTSRVSIAYKRAGITGYRAKGSLNHQLRHTFATMMAEDPDVTVYQLQRLMGHNSINTTERYTRGAGRHVRDAIKRNPIYKMVE